MTPDNSIYYQLAYSAAAIVYVGYVITLVVRRRKLRERAAAFAAGRDRA